MYAYVEQIPMYGTVCNIRVLSFLQHIFVLHQSINSHFCLRKDKYSGILTTMMSEVCAVQGIL